MTTSADQGAIAEVGSPVLIAPAPVDALSPWRWMTGVIAAATLVLLVFNARTIDDWAGELAPNRLTALLRGPTAAWAAATDRLDAPRARLHATWTRVRAARFGKEQPGEQGAAAGGE